MMDGDTQASGTSWADRMEKKEEVNVDGSTKTVVKFELGSDNRMKKTTEIYQVKKVPRGVARRMQWKKFGDAEADGKGVNTSTTIVADEVFLTLSANREALEQTEDRPWNNVNAHPMVSCSYCKGDHWSIKCPYKDTLGPTRIKMEEMNAQGHSDAPAGSTSSAAGGGGGTKYVPPNMRGDRDGKKGEVMSRRIQGDDQAAVRVTNLSEEARESDLRDLFGVFGSIQRIFLAKDRKTQQSKGFAFVHFTTRPDAKRAIEQLNGYGYDHLILKVEWAKPSGPR